MQIANKKFTLLCLVMCLISGFLSASDSIVEMVSDPLKLIVYPKTGNFCLYHTQPEDARYYAPLYDDRAQSSVNIYSILFNGKMFHLNNKSGKKILIDQSKDTITVTFQISLDFLVTQTFSFIPGNNRSTGPILKIVTEIQNISGDIADIAVKAVFDTLLGEKNHIPIYTDLRSEIGSELMLHPVLEKDSVIFSADKGYACMFFLRHEAMTEPTSVYLANWERLVTKTWLPSYVHGRSFRKYASSDPGILYVWSEKKVQNKDILSVTNCIGFYDYRNTSEVVMRFDSADRPAPAVSPSKDVQTAAPVQKKDYRFVQRLLDKIAALEQNPDELSSEKIRQLRKEVDNAIRALQEE
ncbi:MAG: hypothetical protein P1P65_07155 [Treponema sp.]